MLVLLQGDPQENHEPGNETVTSPLEDVQKGGDEWSTKHKSKGPSFQQICDKQGGSGFVESVFLFQDECLVNGEWDGGHSRKDKDEIYEKDALQNLAKKGFKSSLTKFGARETNLIFGTITDSTAYGTSDCPTVGVKVVV